LILVVVVAVAVEVVFEYYSYYEYSPRRKKKKMAGVVVELLHLLIVCHPCYYRQSTMATSHPHYPALSPLDRRSLQMGV
jgi:hypothetical protein